MTLSFLLAGSSSALESAAFVRSISALSCAEWKSKSARVDLGVDLGEGDLDIGGLGGGDNGLGDIDGLSDNGLGDPGNGTGPGLVKY
jgi:hypothetical protein